jgi:hypothetical protein
MDVKKMEERETTQAVPPEFAYIEVRGKRFKVKSLTIEEEGKVVSLRDDLAQGKWGRLAESPSVDDGAWATLLHATAELTYAIVEAPDDFPRTEDDMPCPRKLRDTSYLWQIWGAYAEKMVRPFRPGPVESPQRRAQGAGEERVSPPVVQE